MRCKCQTPALHMSLSMAAPWSRASKQCTQLTARGSCMTGGGRFKPDPPAHACKAVHAEIGMSQGNHLHSGTAPKHQSLRAPAASSMKGARGMLNLTSPCQAALTNADCPWWSTELPKMREASWRIWQWCQRHSF